MAVIGLAMPPDQKRFQRASTLLFNCGSVSIVVQILLLAFCEQIEDSELKPFATLLSSCHELKLVTKDDIQSRKGFNPSQRIHILS